jgi:hypothetical protein
VSSSLRASVTTLTALLLSSQLALAQFTQQGPKLAGTGAVRGGILRGSSPWPALRNGDRSGGAILWGFPRQACQGRFSMA